ncbi:unnamed protein product [Oikopleura dioica]|uniref:palmitoyl-protein hydrolase n=1 Tax=Oikopleura dioica TaxID=34765 RepID=E4X975_OIKDI|nr:unnamed protein product [Oikopleura dioica]
MLCFCTRKAKEGMENNAYRIQPTEPIKGAVIFLHGLGDQGQGWHSEFKQRLSKYRKDIGFIFPNAPEQRVTLNMGMSMPSWFDLYGLSPDSNEDEEGIIKMSKNVDHLVDTIMKEHNIPSEKIVIAGFSQGGALAIYTTLTSSKKFGGAICLSTWLPLRNNVLKAVKDHRFPVFFGHGKSDNIVPNNFGRVSADALKSSGFDVTWKDYPGMGHSSCADEFGDIKQFLDKAI